MPDDPELRGLLWFLLGGTRGGRNRARIISKIRERPWNMNQLAGQLSLQYKAVQHHVRVLQRSSLVIASGERYGMVYSLSPWMNGHMEIFDEVCAKLRFESVGL
ncbi:MAG TPA: winged helix-turn-helix domain-containing protein [Nitrososphaerales archaeon]|nr:winged helix-turn-helix domain-containing protein [Nitrososphaerales archaeon]